LAGSGAGDLVEAARREGSSALAPQKTLHLEVIREFYGDQYMKLPRSTSHKVKKKIKRVRKGRPHKKKS
jgi:hypothetical protein